MSTKKRYYWNVAFIMGLIVIAAVSLSRLLQYNPAFFVDFKLRWQECAYVFRRVDPFAVMSGTARIDNVVGQIPAGAGTVPWAFILGNVFNPGFLPYAIAQKWGGVLYILLPVGSWLLLGRFLYQNKYLSSTKEAYLVSSLMFASYCWYATIATGNQGGMIACLLVIAMCMEEHHPYFSGVLLALCMCKPQIAFVFFWPIVIRKKWKILGTSIAIVCAAWAVSALLTATNMFDMLTAMMNTGLGYTDCNFGLFNMIKYVGGSTKIALLLDVVFALTLFGILVAKIYKNKMESDLLLWYAVMSIISVLWFYHQLHDYLVLVFAGIYIMVLCMQKSAGVGKYLFMAVVFTHAIPPVFQRITARAFSFETDYAYDLGKTIECIIILCGVFYVMQAAYHYKQSSLRKAAGAKEIEGNAE